MKTVHRLFVSVMAVAALLITGNPVPAFSQVRDMPMQGHGGGHGQTMDMPMKGHGAGHGQMMDMPMKGHGAGQGRMMMGRMDKMGDMIDMCLQHAETMGLTDDQIGKIRQLHREIRKKEARFKADLTIANIDRMEITEVKDFDLGKASSAVKKIAELKTAHQLEMLNAMKAIRSMLTDEQFKKMNTMMSSMKMRGRRN